MGYVKRGSVMSGIAGALVAACLVAAGVFLRAAAAPAIGAGIGLATCGALAWVMVPRYQRSGKFMPAGLMSGLSVGMGLFYLFCAM